LASGNPLCPIIIQDISEKLFPVAMPRNWCYQGWYASLHGNKNKASACWKKGRELALKLNMKYEQASLCYEEGRLNARRDSLQQAIERFDALDAKYDLEMAMGLLKSTQL